MTGLRYRTAGESHGAGITVIVEGLPFGLAWDQGFIDRALARRQKGYGRSKRQQMEEDRARVLGGLKKGVTTGGPLALFIENKDQSIERLPIPTTPRPGHADLAGCLKYETRDIRAVLERASARETAGRVAAGAAAALLLREFGIRCSSRVLEVGGVRGDRAVRRAIDTAARSGDSLGGIFEVSVAGVPPGLGGYDVAENRLNARLAQALFAINAIKGVEVGLGFEAARLPGSKVQDEIYYRRGAPWGGFYRKTNRLGGIEGGISTGARIVLRAGMKPIPTLRKGLRTVNLETLRPARAVYQRSDVCAVPAAAVVGEFAVAFEIARAFLERFSGDSLVSVRRAFADYRQALAKNLPSAT